MTQTTQVRRRRRASSAAAAALTLVTISGGLSGTALADRSWNPAVANGSWNAPGNWIGGVVPVSTDNVFIDFNNTTGHAITYNSAFTSNLGLRVRNLGTGSATWRLAGVYGLQVGSFDIGRDGRGLADQSAGTVSTSSDVLLASGVGGTGTYALGGSGRLSVGARLQVGQYGTGLFNQSGGTVTLGTAGTGANELHVGGATGARGTYLLSGSGVLGVSGHGFVGVYGLGTFNQSGGTHTVGTTTAARNLCLAYNGGGTGTYLLSSGMLNVTGSEWVGEYGAGLFDQSGGTHLIGTVATGTNQLNIGRFNGAHGTYLLRGGTLSVSGNEYVGNEGTGTILQSGGRNDLGYGRSLVLGSTATGAGYYGLSSGTVAVQGATLVGTSSGGIGTFVQTGGGHSNFYLNLARGLYQLDGPTASLTSNYYQTVGGPTGARFDHVAGSNTTHDYLTIAPAAGSSGMYNMVGGTLSITGLGHDGVVYVGQSGNGSFVQHGGALRITTYGTTSMALGSGTGSAGRYYMQGGTLTTNSDLVVGPVGLGTFSHTAGTVSIGSGTTSADLYLGVIGGSAGTYLLSGTGVLSVSGGAYLGAGTSSIGTGVFNQSGGTHSAGALYISRTTGVISRYQLGGGALNVSGDEIVGHMGVAAFDQSGGTHTVGGTLYFGHEDPMGPPGGAGSYALSGNSVLKVTGDEVIGRQGDGSFTQSGGTHTIGGNLYFGQVGNLYFNAGQYVLNGTGVLAVGASEYIGYTDGGINTFDHSAGTHSVGADLYVGYSGLGIGGRYTLRGTGALNVGGNELVGYFGGGSFNQSGGMHQVGTPGVPKNLHIGWDTGSTGNYSLSDGALNVSGYESIGAYGLGTFNQSGGTHSVGRDLVIPSGTGGAGTFLLSNDAVLQVAGSTVVGPLATGTFNQTGGTHIIGTSPAGGTLEVGGASGSRYLLSGSSTLSVNGHELITTTGMFDQSGGTHHVQEDLSIDVGSVFYLRGGSVTVAGNLRVDAVSDFVLSGGVLSVNGHVDVGEHYFGFFTHSGGSHTIGTSSTPGNLYLGRSAPPTDAANYSLSGTAVLDVTGSIAVGGDLEQSGMGTTEFRISGGTATVAGTLKVWGYNDTVSYTGGRLSVGTLDMASGGHLLTGPGSNVVLRTNALTIAPTGILDLADNHMIVDYTGAHAPPLELVRSYVAAGYHGGAWDGDRIMSCEGDASAYGLGYAGSWAIFTAFPATFHGQTVDDTAVLITHTRYGDANLDGTVNLTDFNRLAANFGQTDRFWMHGDFNYDGIVNLQDFNRLAANFGLSAGAQGPSAEDWAALAAVVPEPAGAGFASLAAVAMLSRRRRSRVSARAH